MFECKVCGKGKCYWNSICAECGYYQHSLISPTLYKILKDDKKTEELYTKIFDRRGL